MNTIHRLARRSATLVATVAVATLTAPALAAEAPQSPVEIRSCTTVYAPTPEQVYAMGSLTPAGVEISFVNRSSAPIEEVAFAFGADASGPATIDRGSFAPGAMVTHVLWIANAPIAACRVAAVRFTGGPAITVAGAPVAAAR